MTGTSSLSGSGKLAAALLLAIGLSGAAKADDMAPHFRSRIAIFDMGSRTVTTLFTSDALWEAPNWSPDGSALLVNSGAMLYRIPVSGPEAGKPEPLAVAGDLRCNNDKSFSPDGKAIAFSAGVGTTSQSFVYVAAADGTQIRAIDSVSPSYFHGWSPDGHWVAVVAKRGAHFNLYRVAASGGPEDALTTAQADDDGPDYAPDGAWIYFNSNRSGHWHIWRMPKDGAGPHDGKAEQMTDDDGEDWFPHPSPDGKSAVFLTFPPGTATHNDRMAGMRLRMISLAESNGHPPAITTLLTFFGGQGSINVNSWSPDSRRFAFVSYEPLLESHPE